MRKIPSNIGSIAGTQGVVYADRVFSREDQWYKGACEHSHIDGRENVLF